MPFWITAIGHNGRPFIIGYSKTYSEASRYVEDNLQGTGAEIHELATNDKGKAVQMIRYEMTKSAGFETATRNFRHSREVA